MTRGLPPRFRLQKLAPPVIKREDYGKGAHRKGTANARGYDDRWNRLSIAYRKRHPWCLFCQQQGREELTALVDHILPLVDRPDLRLAWKNLAALCESCHGLKAKLEAEARKLGNIDVLVLWVKDPSTRPINCRPIVSEPPRR